VSEEEARCENCGRPAARSGLDDAGWCERCRAAVIRRATIYARGAAALLFLLGGWLLVAFVHPGARSLILWLILLCALCLLVYRLVRRVAFELVRSSGVPPPPDRE
jgi:hypothetical protein